MFEGMLAKRIAGVLRQYPNPEVAFYTTLVLLGHHARHWYSRPYTKGCASREKRGRYVRLHGVRAPVRFFTYYRDVDGRMRSREVPGDAPIDLERCVEAYGYPPGRRRLRDDLLERYENLGAYMQEMLANGQWFDDTDLNQTLPTEVLSTWAAAWVNRWLKGFASVQTVEDEWKHYASINLLIAKMIELADYVGHNRVDPGRLTLNQLIYRSRRWHAAIARAQAVTDRREMAKLTPPADRVFDDGAYSIFRLTDREALAFEGKMMIHCVATYTERVRGGACEIYSVRDAANIPYATLEVRGHDVWQIKGIKNARITDPELCQVIANFLASAGFVNRTDSCQLEPAPIEVEPGGEDEVPAGLGYWRGWY